MNEVGVAELRRELKGWLDRARAGEDIVVTDRGHPVARISGIAASPALQRLIDEGRLSAAPTSVRPAAGGRSRVAADHDIAGLVVAERDTRR